MANANPSSTTSRILARIRAQGRGRTFTNKDLLDLGNRTVVAQALQRLMRRGYIRRIGRGLYLYPRRSELLNKELAPNVPDAAKAIARSKGIRIQPNGATAANLLGLSTQVPAQWVFLTDGPNRAYRLGNQTIVFRHVSPRMLFPGRPTSHAVLQALRYLGRDGVDDDVIKRLSARLSPSDKRALVRDAKFSANWLVEIAKRIAGSDQRNQR